MWFPDRSAARVPDLAGFGSGIGYGMDDEPFNLRLRPPSQEKNT